MIATAEAERRLFEIVRRHFTKAPMLEPSTRLRDDLGADSLDLVELMFDVEQEFGVEISDAQVVEIQTLGDALALLQKDAV